MQMTKHIRQLAFSVFYFAVCISIDAQSLTFHNIGLREGMSNGFVVDLAIDGQGFVWAATESGLNRIAGRKCTIFKKDNSDISSNDCVGVFYDSRSNRVFVHFKNGALDAFNCDTQRFEHINIVPNSLSMSVTDVNGASDGGVWIAYYNGALQHFNPLTGESWWISSKEFPQAVTGVRSILDDGHDHLYIGLRMKGLYLYNLRTHHAQYFCHQPTDPSSLPGDNVRYVFIDHLQNIWVGTNMGLGLFNPLTGRFRVFKHDQRDPTSLESDNIHSIMETHRHQLWISSDVGGISILDLNRSPFPYSGPVSFKQIVRENSGLSSNNIRRTCQDSYGNVWIGNYSTGVDFVPSQGSVFHTLSVQGKPLRNVIDILLDRLGNLWVGQDNKISEIREGKILHTWSFASALSTASGTAYSLEYDDEGNMWVGTNDNGALYMDSSTHRFTRFPYGQTYDVHAIYKDERGKVWIGSENGLFSFDHGKARIERNLYNQMHAKTPATIYTISSDKLGQLWIGCVDKGVFIFNRQQKMVAHIYHGLPSHAINHIFRDHDGEMWLATFDGLVEIPDPSRPYHFRVYNEREGLKDGHLRAISQDLTGNIWVSTFSGIACFDVHRRKFYNYDYHSGIPTGNFAESSSAAASDGTLFFGSPGGVCCFNPRLLSVNEKVSPVEIINCERIGLLGDKSKKNIVVKNEEGLLCLAHDDNAFKFSFTVKNFSQDGDVEYSYMMGGFDDQWFLTEGDQEVTFRNLKPGKYTFMVRAKLRNQDWSSASKAETEIIILPPFWATWWAKGIYLLLSLAMVSFVVKEYRRRLRLQNSLEKTQWENRHRQQLNEERMRFFTNTTHELRTPLTLILGPIEDLVHDERLPQTLRKKVLTIQDGAERLLALINDILEFRKTETGNRRLIVAHGNLCTLVREIGCRLKDLNRNPSVEVHVQIGEDIPDLYFDSEIVTTVINNLMSNAIKYTPNGTITLSLLRISEGEVGITVSDTGYGIDKKDLPQIFDRYYQVNAAHQASGTGIGLALVKSLAELHHARIEVDSTLGEGSKFSLILSLDEHYPDALHKNDPVLTADSRTRPVPASVQDQRAVLLIVEDNADIRQYMDDCLHDDYRVIQASQGQDGLEQAFSVIPDLIISDIMMPEMDGIEMTRRIKGDMRTSHIPVILLTAKTSMESQEEGYESGADSYLTKPFSASLLQSRIRNLMSSRRRLAEYIASNPLVVPGLGKSIPGATNLKGLGDLDRKFLEKMDGLIMNHLASEDLDVAFFTDRMAMSHSTLFRKLKALTGMNINEYVKKAKLRRSMELLRSGKYNVNEVVALTGFNNVGNFRQSFKREFGMNPSDVLK